MLASAGPFPAWLGAALAIFENLVLAVTLLVTVITAYLVSSQARAHFEVDKVHRFIERWNEPAMSASVAKVEELLEDLDDAENPSELSVKIRFGEDEQSERARAEHRAVYNLLQEIGATHKRGLLHDELFGDLFASIVQRYYEGLAPYVLAMRGHRSRVSLLEDWEWLAVRTRAREARRSAGAGTGAPPPKRLQRNSRALLTDIAVFGYGSLVHPDSAARTVRGPWAPYQLARVWPAQLHGYQRAWNYRQDVQLLDPDEPAQLTFLGLEPRADWVCPGVLLPVMPEDLPQLDKRERDYKRIDITDRIEYHAEFLRGRDRYRKVYTYIPEHPVDTSAQAVVPASYVRLLERAQDVWGEELDPMFKGMEILPPGLRALDRPYRFTDPEQNAAAGR